MKKKIMILSIIIGIFVVGLCVRFAVNGRENPEIENASVEESMLSDELSTKPEQENEAPEETGEARSEGVEPEEVRAGQEPKDEIAVAKIIDLEKPIVKLKGKEGELSYRWGRYMFQIDDDTLLTVCDCYFPEERMQQKIFYLAKAPDFVPWQVFRWNSKVWDEESDPESPRDLESRIWDPQVVNDGYIYEVEGVLYLLDKNFQQASVFCDLSQLMGDLLEFPVGMYDNTCAVSSEASRILACTVEGLYEYDLKSGEKTLLESAFFTHREIVHAEEDCACGVRDFEFDGPVKVMYAPDGQSYAFLTGTEEADWGDITGVVLRSGEGETLYQKKTEYMYDFQWVESKEGIYLAVFYTDDDGGQWMDRVDADTGEKETFAVPFAAGDVGFLGADSLVYEQRKQSNTGFSEAYQYQLYSGESQELEAVGEVDWGLVMIYGDYYTIPVRYPKNFAQTSVRNGYE